MNKNKNILSKAWENYEAGNYKKSECFFKTALKNEPVPENRDNILFSYGYTLTALKHFDKAEKIYKDLFKKHRSHIHIHQLGMVQREAGKYEKALKLYFKEKAMIDKKDNLAKAMNLYELGKNNELLGRFTAAKKYADKCVQTASKCDDFIMKACAYRLAGEMEKNGNIIKAVNCYKKAKRYFDKGNDKIGAKNINSLISDLKKKFRKRGNTNPNDT